eukprot:gene34718-44903_t
MIQDIVKSSSSMIAKLKRTGENSNRNDNFLLDQYFKRGLAYEKLNKIDRAIADFTACIDINGRCAAAYFNRSNLNRIKHNLSNAMDDLNKAVSLEPENADYSNNRQMLLRESGNYLNAINDAKRSVYLAKPSTLVSEEKSGSGIKSVELAFSIPKNARTESDLLPIIQAIKKSKIFHQFEKEPNILVEIASKMELTICQPGEYLYNDGDSHSEIHIILEGGIKIAKKSEVIDEEGGITNDLVILIVLSQGQFFGHGQEDLVPIEDENSGKVCASCIVSDIETRLLTLKKEDYDHIFHRFNNTVREETFKMLRTSCYSYFRKWDEDKIRAMAAAVKIKYFNYNRKVIKSGMLVKELFILRKGLIKIIKPVPKKLLLRSDEHVEVGLDGKVKSRSISDTPASMMSRSNTNDPSNGSVFLSQKLSGWVDSSTIDNDTSSGDGIFDPMLNPLIEGILPTDSNSEGEGITASNRGSGTSPRSSRQQKLSSREFGGFNDFTNSKSGESRSRLNTAHTTHSRSRNSTRGGRMMSQEEEVDEWFTVATLMPDQVLGEVSILHQMDKYLPGSPKSTDDSNAKVEKEQITDLPFSSYTAVACTAVEVYTFDAELLLSMGVAQNARIVSLLRESLRANNPSPESIAAAYNSKFRRTLQKDRIMKSLN